MTTRDIPIIFSAPMVRALIEGRKTMTRRLAWGKWKEFPEIKQRLRKRSPWTRVKAGDRLWVRENFARNANQLSETVMDTSIVYAADGAGRALDNGTEKPWTPCIHMPRAASRLTLIVTATKIEPLQDISEADACAEGWTKRPEISDDPAVHADAARDWFSDLWGSLHGAESWDANPLVVALTFRVVRTNIDSKEARP